MKKKWKKIEKQLGERGGRRRQRDGGEQREGGRTERGVQKMGRQGASCRKKVRKKKGGKGRESVEKRGQVVR